MNILSPSLLSIDFNHIADDVAVLDKAGTKWFHLDIMDGVFVPNISYGPPVVKSIRGITDSFFDVHLMITEPIRYVDAFKEAGADMLTVHYEACSSLRDTIESIKAKGMKAGVAISPETPVEVLKEYVRDVDMILVMSVKPGFGGQKFMPIALDKLKQVKQYAESINKDLLIQVDGGITLDNVPFVLEVGANVVVAGSAVFKGDIEANVKEFHRLLDKDA
ncbi:MAG: ribulose-phosphate 3-epimerase [Wujia sp.]